MAHIKSINFSQTEILKDILTLYIKSDTFDLDPTYSLGNFYKDIPPPLLKYDLHPKTKEVKEADCRQLPLEDQSISSIIFDPPFIVRIPNKTSKDSIINNRFSSFLSKEDLLNTYEQALREFYRILKSKGYLVFKCQDVVLGTKQWLIHCDVFNLAISLGYEVIDMFILLAKHRLMASNWKIQHHARKYHSYFLVFQKPRHK